MIRKLVIWSFALIVVLPGWISAAQVGGIPNVSPEQQRIADAASIKDPALREVALRQAIEEGLLRRPFVVSDDVMRYLSKNSRWIDLRPLEDIIKQYHGYSSHDNDGAEWIGQITWDYLPRTDRLQVCRKAIETGMARESGLRPIPRSVAIQSIGWYGFPELLPLANSYYPTLDKVSQETLSLTEIAIEAKLKDGCEGREDCAGRAAERLAAMSDTEFKQNMDSDEDFANVALNQAKFVCERNPFTGWVNPGCKQIQQIYDRQEALDKKIQAEKAAEGIKPQVSQPPEPGKVSWLQLLRSASHYDVRYSPR